MSLLALRVSADVAWKRGSERVPTTDRISETAQRQKAVGPRSWRRHDWLVWLVGLLVASTIYAVLRYAVLGEVPMAHFPSYLMNKAISMTAVAALLFSAVNHAFGRNRQARLWGLASAFLVFLHILLSLGLLSRDYYPKFFAGNGMTFWGEVMLVAGVFGAAGYWIVYTRRHHPPRRSVILGITALFGALHLFAMGWKGWFVPVAWPGGMPPISLLSFLLVVAAAIFLFRSAAITS